MVNSYEQKISGSLSPDTLLTQKQKLSAGQLHSVKILESSVNDLELSLRELVNSNPLLELASVSDLAMQEQKEENIDLEEWEKEILGTPSQESFGAKEEKSNSNIQEKEWEDHLQDLAEDPGELESKRSLYNEDHYGINETFSQDQKDPKDFFFDSLSKEHTLKELLMEELSFSNAGSNIKRAAECIIGSLEENGYFTDPITDIAQTSNTTLEEAQEALHLVQSFHPPGVAASSLSECLLLQLKRQNIKDKILERIIKDFLEDVGRNRLPYIAEKLHIRMEKLQKALERLRKLDPHPGAKYNPEKVQNIIPDVIVRETINGEFIAVLNDKNMPKLYFNDSYTSLINSSTLSPEEKNYFKEKTSEGKKAIYELEHRSSTILRIAKLIVSEQYEFFKYGGSALKPLTMHLAADKLGLDDSTISRACNRKYMLTPRGLFEFRYFFNTGFTNQNGEEASNKAVMEMIREMIEKEDPAKPLSDDRISGMLKEKGYSIARRTVMKYRENMHIASSQGRRSHL